MAKETVIIGCKLPNGLILEVGYTLDPTTGVTVKSSKYGRLTLKGWNEHSRSARENGIDVPHGMNTSPYLNRGVDKELWDAWVSAHPDSWLLKNEILFVAKDEASAALRAAESTGTPAPLAPLPKDKPTVPGITVADFAKKTGTGG